MRQSVLFGMVIMILFSFIISAGAYSVDDYGISFDDPPGWKMVDYSQKDYICRIGFINPSEGDAYIGIEITRSEKENIDDIIPVQRSFLEDNGNKVTSESYVSVNEKRSYEFDTVDSGIFFMKSVCCLENGNLYKFYLSGGTEEEYENSIEAFNEFLDSVKFNSDSSEDKTVSEATIQKDDSQEPGDLVKTTPGFVAEYTLTAAILGFLFLNIKLRK